MHKNTVFVFPNIFLHFKYCCLNDGDQCVKMFNIWSKFFFTNKMIAVIRIHHISIRISRTFTILELYYYFISVTSISTRNFNNSVNILENEGTFLLNTLFSNSIYFGWILFPLSSIFNGLCFLCK